MCIHVCEYACSYTWVCLNALYDTWSRSKGREVIAWMLCVLACLGKCLQAYECLPKHLYMCLHMSVSYIHEHFCVCVFTHVFKHWTSVQPPQCWHSMIIYRSRSIWKENTHSIRKVLPQVHHPDPHKSSILSSVPWPAGAELAAQHKEPSSFKGMKQGVLSCVSKCAHKARHRQGAEWPAHQGWAWFWNCGMYKTNKVKTDVIALVPWMPVLEWAHTRT